MMGCRSSATSIQSVAERRAAFVKTFGHCGILRALAGEQEGDARRIAAGYMVRARTVECTSFGQRV